MTRSWTNGWLTFLAAAICAVGMSGCTSCKSGIDPSGEHVFAPPPLPSATTTNASDLRYFDNPLNPLPYDDIAVLIEPRETVVPVGSEVVITAGVAGQDGYLRTNRRLEWSIAPGGVGQFVDVEKNGMLDLMLGDFNWPRKVTSTYAIGSTSRDNVRLNRGTPTLDDDKFVLRGQGWITLTSPVEGTSHVTVVAPEVYGWEARTKSATVHFVDAVVQFPPPAINPAGTEHVFTTTVTRYSNQSPCENWLVRYEIVGGPAAGFVPDGASVVEVRTNSAGQGCAKIAQKQAASGVNKIAIQVIRPVDAPSSGGQRLVVRGGMTTKTWSAPDLAVHVTGPATVSVGGTTTYQIDLSNLGDLPAKDVTAAVDVPDGLTFVAANPAAEVAGRQLRWRLGDLGARQRRPIEISFRAEKQGSAVACCEATAAGGLKVRDCATTTISLPGAAPAAAAPPAASGSMLGVSATAAQNTVNVGEKVTFDIAVTNRSQAAMTHVLVRARLDSGLTHPKADANNVIERELENGGLLSAGETRRFTLVLQATKPGRLGVSVDVSASNVAPANVQGVVTAVGNPVTPPPVTPSPIAPPSGGSAAVPLTVTVTGPNKPLAVGKTATFAIEIRNTGNAAIQNVKVIDHADAVLDSTDATDGWRQMDNPDLMWNIKVLSAGESVTFNVQCTCKAVAAKAYHYVTVTLADGGRAEGNAYVEIVNASETPSSVAPPPTIPKLPAATTPTGGGLSLSAAGLANPVRPDKELTYEIRVVNKEATAFKQVTVTATIPTGMVPAPGTVGAKVNGQQIQFNTEPELAPGGSLVYQAKVIAKTPGNNYRLHVELTADGLPKPMTYDSNETEVSN
jgi:uncharacterized repeat protein (TIGR01451 family)